MHRIQPKSRSRSAGGRRHDFASAAHMHDGAGQTGPRDFGSFWVTSSGSKTLLVCLFGFMALTLLVPTLAGGSQLSERIVTGLAAAAFALVTVRVGLTKVDIAPSGLKLRTYYKTYRLSWDQVVGAEVSSTGRAGTYSLVEVELTDGQFVRVDGVVNSGRPEEVTEVSQAVDFINLYAAGTARAATAIASPKPGPGPGPTTGPRMPLTRRGQVAVFGFGSLSAVPGIAALILGFQGGHQLVVLALIGAFVVLDLPFWLILRRLRAHR